MRYEKNCAQAAGQPQDFGCQYLRIVADALAERVIFAPSRARSGLGSGGLREPPLRVPQLLADRQCGGPEQSRGFDEAEGMKLALEIVEHLLQRTHLLDQAPPGRQGQRMFH
jgi:hypothetical protein